MHAPAEARPAVTSFSIPVTIFAAIISMIGVFCMESFILTQNWFYFLFAVPCAFLGGLLLFSRFTGPESA